MLEKTLESPLDYKEIQPVHSEGDQSLVFIGRTDVGAETPILWPPHAKSWLIGKYPDAGKDWRQEDKGTMEDEIFGWHHQLDGHEFEQTPGVGAKQGSLMCCSPWGHKESVISTDWGTEMIIDKRTLHTGFQWIAFWINICIHFEMFSTCYLLDFGDNYFQLYLKFDCNGVVRRSFLKGYRVCVFVCF